VIIKNMPLDFRQRLAGQMLQFPADLAFKVQVGAAACGVFYMLIAGAAHPVHGISAQLPAFRQFVEVAVDGGAPDGEGRFPEMLRDLRGGNMGIFKRDNIAENGIALFRLIASWACHAITPSSNLKHGIILSCFFYQVNKFVQKTINICAVSGKNIVAILRAIC